MKRMGKVKKQIKIEVQLTPGHEKRFTQAILNIYEKRERSKREREESAAEAV